jgi:aspartyl-tRNA(Asn)/glutamyl-tRNA(Gln) amidotransferase subunit A
LGPLAQTVEDCVLIDAALSGAARPRIRKAAIKGRTFLVPTDAVLDGADEAVRANFDAAVSRISKAGGKIKRVAMPAFAAILDLVSTRGHILGAEALHVHGARVNGPDAARMDARVVKRIKMADTMTAVDLVEVMRQRARLIAETNALFGDAIMIFPTTPHVAPPIAPLEADMEEFFRVNAKTLRNCTLGNFLDWCGLSIPSGVDTAGMPTGFLLNAPHGRDADVLSVGLAIEELVRGDAD